MSRATQLPNSYPKGKAPKKEEPERRVGRRSGSVGNHLSDEKVVALRKRAADGEGDADLAMRFNISKATVANLRTGATRKYVGGPITKKKAQGGK